MESIRIIRQVRIISVSSINNPNVASPLIQQQPQQLAPAPPRNYRCANLVNLLMTYCVCLVCLILGAIHLNDCPAQNKLPLCLVILGGMMVVERLLNCVYDCRSVCEEYREENPPSCLVLLNLLFTLAEFGTVIAVSYYVFSMNPVTDPGLHNDKNYCDYGLYKTSFYGCIIELIFYGLCLLCGCCKACADMN